MLSTTNPRSAVYVWHEEVVCVFCRESQPWNKVHTQLKHMPIWLPSRLCPICHQYCCVKMEFQGEILFGASSLMSSLRSWMHMTSPLKRSLLPNLARICCLQVVFSLGTKSYHHGTYSTPQAFYCLLISSQWDNHSYSINNFIDHQSVQSLVAWWLQRPIFFRVPLTIDSSHGGLIDVIALASTEAAISGSCCSVCSKGSGICRSSRSKEAKASCCVQNNMDVGCCDELKDTVCLVCKEADGCGGQKELAGLTCGSEKGGCYDKEKLKDPCCGSSGDGNPYSGKQEVDDKENLDMVSYVNSHCFVGEFIFMFARFGLYVLDQCAYQWAQSPMSVFQIAPSIADPNPYTAISNQNSASSKSNITWSSSNDVTDTSAGYLGAYTSSLHACCQALVKIPPSPLLLLCLAPCQEPYPCTTLSAFNKWPLPCPEKTTITSTAGVEPIGGEKLQLEIRGMDCMDCIPKVGHALAQLPTITSTNIYHFSGIAEWLYNPETILPLKPRLQLMG